MVGRDSGDAKSGRQVSRNARLHLGYAGGHVPGFGRRDLHLGSLSATT
jgi:hypothetical protein